MQLFFKTEYFIIFLLFFFFTQDIDTFEWWAYCFWPFPSEVGCCNRFVCRGVGITINEFSLSSSDQSDSDEPSTICSSFTLSVLLSGVATRIDSSISLSFRQRSESSCFFSSVVLRFLAGVVLLAEKLTWKGQLGF